MPVLSRVPRRCRNAPLHPCITGACPLRSARGPDCASWHAGPAITTTTSSMALHAPMRLAVLIDTENVTPAAADELFEAVGKLGMATVRRAYGNWSSPAVGGWKGAAHQHALQPVHRHGCTPGKNTTDIALIIDAMDLLHGGRVDGFCLVASDGDYSQLVTRIREQGLPVFGFGVSPPHPARTAACTQFMSLAPNQGVPAPAPEPSALASAAQKAPEPVEPRAADSLPRGTPEHLRILLTQAVQDAAPDNGWALLSAVGNAVHKRCPDFSVKDHGCSKLGKLVSQQDYLETRLPDSSATMLVRIRPGTALLPSS